MSYAKWKKEEGDMFARKDIVRTAQRDVLEAKPKNLTKEQFARLYESVTRRISKSLAILAK